MQNNLDEILNLIAELRDFLDRVNIQDTDNNQDNLIAEINQKIPEITELLSLSLLTGEYIKYKNFTHKVEEIKKETENLLPYFYTFSDVSS